MFGRRKETPESIANGIARDIGRRGFAAEAKPSTVHSPFGDAILWSVIVPNRGVAVVNNELRIVVASSNKPVPQAPAFTHTTAEADAEQTLRNLPLP